MTDLYIMTRSVMKEILVESLQAMAQKTAARLAILEWAASPAGVYPAETALAEIGRLGAGNLLSGCLFGEEADIQWRRVPEDYGDQRPIDRRGQPRFWLVVVSEQNYSMVGWNPHPDVLNKTAIMKDIHVLLWGSKNHAGVWYELRIPRSLSYPIKPKGGELDYACLSMRSYIDASGNVVACRRMDIRAQSEEGEKNGR